LEEAANSGKYRIALKERGRVDVARAKSRGIKLLLATVLCSYLPTASAQSINDALSLEHAGKSDEARAEFEALAKNPVAAYKAKCLMEIARIDLAAGHFSSAIRFGKQAADAFRARGDARATGEALTIVGNAETYANDYEAARRDITEALTLARTTGEKAEEVTRLNNLGNIYYFQGKYGEGLATLRSAMKIVDANVNAPWNASRRQLTAANIAVVYQRLGQNQMALEIYLELRSKHNSLKVAEQGQLLTNIGALYRRLGDPIKALDVYREAGELYRQQRSASGEISAAINIGIASALDLKRYQAALTAFEGALQAARLAGDKRSELQAALYRAETLNRMGRPHDAEAAFTKVAADAGALRAGEEHWKALYALAMFDLSRGDALGTLAKATETVHLIETIREDGPSGLRAGFLADKRQVYDLLIELLAQSFDVARTIRAMEASRSRTVQDQKGAVTLRDIQNRLPPDKSLLEYWIGENALVSVKVSRVGADVQYRRLPNLRKRLRLLREKLSDPAGDDWRAIAAEMGAALGPWKDVADFVVVADRELTLVPFEALLDGTKPLGESRIISYLPSAALLSTNTWERPLYAPYRPTLLALADPAPANEAVLDLATGAHRERLQSASREVAWAAGLVGGRTRVLQGSAATKQALYEGLKSGFPFVHLATHAYSDPDDGRHSWILFANNDYLFPGELAAMDMKGIYLAVLSACDTDAGKLTEGEGPESLARAMLGAGARSVVASLWKADDASTAQLMKRFYRELADGAPAAVALANAKRDFAKSRPHPFYWASFILSGDPKVKTPRTIPWTWLGAGVLAAAGLLLIRTSLRKA
jgi:tetratricopeptide (TPR) repeat protein